MLAGTHRDAAGFFGRSRLPDFLQLLRCAAVRLVCLHRRNWVKHAVSITRQAITNALCKTWTPMRQQGEACKARVGTKHLSLKRLGAELPSTRRSLEALLSTCDAHRTAVGDSGVYSVAYEDLAYGAGAEAAWQALQRWLGAPPRRINYTATIKMTSANLSASIANFAEVERFVAERFSEGGLEHRLLTSTD